MIEFSFPKTNHNSSAKCGAKGDNKIDNGFNTLDEEHFFSVNLFTRIINELTQVLNEKFSISWFIFLIV